MIVSLSSLMWPLRRTISCLRELCRGEVGGRGPTLIFNHTCFFACKVRLCVVGEKAEQADRSSVALAMGHGLVEVVEVTDQFLVLFIHLLNARRHPFRVPDDCHGECLRCVSNKRSRWPSHRAQCRRKSECRRSSREFRIAHRRTYLPIVRDVRPSLTGVEVEDDLFDLSREGEGRPCPVGRRDRLAVVPADVHAGVGGEAQRHRCAPGGSRRPACR